MVLLTVYYSHTRIRNTIITFSSNTDEYLMQLHALN